VHAVIPKLRELLATVWANSRISRFDKGKADADIVKRFTTDKGWLDLNHEASRSLDQMVKAIAESTLRSRYSKRYIENNMTSIVLKTAGVSSDEIKSLIDRELEQTLTKLEQAKMRQYKIAVPISGLKVEPAENVAKVGLCWFYSIGNK
jgi:hypothetical protein